MDFCVADAAIAHIEAIEELEKQCFSQRLCRRHMSMALWRTTVIR